MDPAGWTSPNPTLDVPKSNFSPQILRMAPLQALCEHPRCSRAERIWEGVGSAPSRLENGASWGCSRALQVPGAEPKPRRALGSPCPAAAASPGGQIPACPGILGGSRGGFQRRAQAVARQGQILPSAHVTQTRGQEDLGEEMPHSAGCCLCCFEIGVSGSGGRGAGRGGEGRGGGLGAGPLPAVPFWHSGELPALSPLLLLQVQLCFLTC